MNHAPSVSRRSFVQGAALGVAAGAVASGVAVADEAPVASTTTNITATVDGVTLKCIVRCA